MQKRDLAILLLSAFAIYFSIQNEGTFYFRKAWSVFSHLHHFTISLHVCMSMTQTFGTYAHRCDWREMQHAELKIWHWRKNAVGWKVWVDCKMCRYHQTGGHAGGSTLPPPIIVSLEASVPLLRTSMSPVCTKILNTWCLHMSSGSPPFPLHKWIGRHSRSQCTKPKEMRRHRCIL